MKMDAAFARSLFWFTALGLTFALSFAIDRPFLANSSKLFLTDFRAFYCAGYVHARGYDPYMIEPLRSCEHRVAPDSDLPSNIVVPAPLPGYDLAFFSSLAALPFPTAAALWEISLVLAFIATVVALVRLTAIESEVIFSCLLFSDLMLSLSLGQMVPISVAALSGAMLAISRRQCTIAAILTTISLIEPHLGLGAFFTLVLLAPQARWAAIACGGTLGLISLYASDASGTFEYFHTVLPVHVLSEVRSEEQYGFTFLLHTLGCANGMASFLGSLSYAVMIGIGIHYAHTLRRRTGEPAFLIAAPTAFALIGSPFLHIHQMAAALPAALLSYARFPKQRRLLGSSILLLAVPWSRFHPLLLLSLLLVPLTLLLSSRLLKASFSGQMLILGATFSVVIAACVAFTPPTDDFSMIPTVNAYALAETVWGPYVNLHFTQNSPLFFLLKLPTWSALLMIAAAMISAYGKNDEPS